MKTFPLSTTSSVDEKLLAWCPNLSDWAQKWRMEDRDVSLGEEIVALLRPFLIHLLQQNMTRRTFCRHRDNVWLLGGEIIREVNFVPELRRCSALELVRETVCDVDGPLISPALQEREQQSFDATCRLLHRFLENPAGEREATSPDYAS